MNISAASFSNARTAEFLLNDVILSSQQRFQASTSFDSNRLASSGGDTLTLSAAATAFLISQAKTGSPAITDATNNTTTDGSNEISAQGSNNGDLVLALENAQSEGQSTNITFNESNGTIRQPVATGALASVINSINETGAVYAQPGESAAELTFANEYAAQKAEGAAGRFYNEVNVNLFTAGFSSAEKASFITAYNNQTLDIQSVNDAAGVTIEDAAGATAGGSGQSYATFSETATGSGGSGGGYGEYLDVSDLEKTNQYVVDTGSPFFGDTVVSWGGAAASQTTPPWTEALQPASSISHGIG